MGRKIIQKFRGQRNIKRCKTKNVILFGFEGENKTEKKYFQNFQGREKSYNIDFAYGNETDPLKIVNNLVNYMKEKDISSRHGDKIYCVFDTDVDMRKQDQINKAIAKASKKGIEIIMSVPSFEIWYILHFIETTHCFNSNEELIKKLRKFIPSYEKNRDVFCEVNSNLGQAINMAKKIKSHHNIKEQEYITDMICNPCTDVYKVVEYIINKNNE